MTESPETIASRTSFQTNVMRGSKLMSAFQMERGYKPSVLGIPRSIISEDILNIHVEHSSIREIERIMRFKSSETIDPNKMNMVNRILVYHKRSKQNEPNEWISAYVVKIDPHVNNEDAVQRAHP